MRQPLIGIVNRDMMAFDKIGRKDHRISQRGRRSCALSQAQGQACCSWL
jgi:hypothetical protein